MRATSFRWIGFVLVGGGLLAPELASAQQMRWRADLDLSPSNVRAQDAVALGDLNRDGVQDYFVVTNTSHQSRLFLSSGDRYVPTSRRYEMGYSLDTDDFDRDGQPDMLIKSGRAKTTRARVYFIDQRRTVRNPDDRLVPWQTLVPNESCHYVDVNRDGTKDLIMVHHKPIRGTRRVARGKINVSYYVGTGSRTLSRAPFRLQWQGYVREYTGNRSIRWGAVQHLMERGRRYRGTHLLLVGAFQVAQPLGYITYHPSPTGGYFDTNLVRLIPRTLIATNVRTEPRMNVAMVSSDSGSYLFGWNFRTRRYQQLFHTPESSADFWCFRRSGRWYLVISEDGSDSVHVFHNGLPEGRPIRDLGLFPVNDVGLRYLKGRDTNRDGVIEELIIARQGGASLFDFRLP